jgi:hypothetical protein
MSDQTAPAVKQGPLFLAWAKASERGRCDCCDNNPDPSDPTNPDYAVVLMRFGQYVVALCGPCLRRLKNQLRRAEG